LPHSPFFRPWKRGSLNSHQITRDTWYKVVLCVCVYWPFFRELISSPPSYWGVFHIAGAASPSMAPRGWRWPVGHVAIKVMGWRRKSWGYHGYNWPKWGYHGR
jgi:hypothetical protein